MADPLVLIPGLNCTARLFSAQINALSGARAIEVPDHRGHNAISSLATAILEEAPPRFALAGLSMGGYIAFEIMRQAAERVTRLALMDTTAKPDSPERVEIRREQIDLARNGQFDRIADLQIPMLIHQDRQDDEELKGIIRKMAADTGAEGFIRQMTAIMGRPDSRSDLGAIKCPTLVLVGEGDRLTPPSEAEEMHAGIAGSRLVVVPGSGHLSTLEKPTAVSDALADWLKM